MNARDGQKSGGVRAWLSSSAAAGLAVALALSVATAAISAAGPKWLSAAVTSRSFIACDIVMVVCSALLGGIVAMLWRAGRANRGLPRGEHGEAIIEFALAMPFVAMISLLMAQTSFVMVGNGCVHYSAYCAARAACVMTPLRTAAEDRNLVTLQDGPKMQRVRMAAAWALMPVACGAYQSPRVDSSTAADLVSGLQAFFSALPQRIAPEESYSPDSKGKHPQWVDQQYIPAARGDAPAWVDDRLVKKFCYVMDPLHTTVEMAPPEDGNSYKAHEDLRVTVKHKLYLSIPYAARIFAAFPGGSTLDVGTGEYATEITGTCTMPNEGSQDYVDVERFPP